MAINDTHVLRADDNEKLTPLSEEEFEEPISGAIEVIDAPHGEIHYGRHFVSSGQEVLGLAATKIFLITTPNSEVYTHITPPKLRSTGESNVAFYEEPTTSAAGSVVGMFNRNRNSDNVNASVLTVAPTVSNNGTKIFEQHIGSGQNGQGESRGESEFVLKPNTKYLIIITSEAASNDVSWVIDWYEHATLAS
jgi:hypothetical protein